MPVKQALRVALLLMLVGGLLAELVGLLAG
jgi:hypothetical protein